MTKTHSVIVAALAHEKNLYDAHTLPEVLDQAEANTDIRAARAIVDRGYRGRKFVDGTEILVPGRVPGKIAAKSAAIRKCFRRRAAIEPLISHLKHDFRLLRCFLKGFQGDHSISCWPRQHGISENGCGGSLFFGFASFTRSLPKTFTPQIIETFDVRSSAS